LFPSTPMLSTTSSLFFHTYPPHRHPLSFPTRRSSDLRNRRYSAVHSEFTIDCGNFAANRRNHCERHWSVDNGNGSACWPRNYHRDRKSTRLNSSHQIISYAVFCLKKKNRKNI